MGNRGLTTKKGLPSKGLLRSVGDLVLLERSHEVALVGGSLEATVAHLGRRVDELQLDVLQSSALGVHQQRLRRKNKMVCINI